MAVVFLLASPARAQSVLNFTPRGNTGIAITNTTSYAADVKLTLYNSDGSQATTAVLNPVSQRIPARGQAAFLSTQIFSMKDGARQNTWIQATSSVSGLQGFYFSGDFVNAFDGAEASEPQLVQTIPYIPGPGTTTSLLVTNPAPQPADVTITFYDAAGAVVANSSFPLESHEQLIFPVNARVLSALVSSNIGVLATAIEDEDSGASLVLINGQGPKSQAMRFVAPYFENRDHTVSQLVLNNPGSTAVEATVTLFMDSGAQRSSHTHTLSANSSTVLDGSAILGTFIPAPHEGWLLVESGAPVSGLVLLTSKNNARTALPLQTAPSDRMLFSRFADNAFFNSALILVGSDEREAQVTLTLHRSDGTTVSRTELTLPPQFRDSRKIRDLVSISESDLSGYITVQSSIPIYGMELMYTQESSSHAGIGPQKLVAGFQAGPAVGVPRINSIVGVPDAPPGVTRIRIDGANIANNPTLYVNGRVVPMTPFGDLYTADIPPQADAGYITVRIRANGLDSNAWTIGGVFPNNVDIIDRVGHAMYQKVELTENGFDPNRTVMVPIRNARVEVVDSLSQVLSVSETDEQGGFVIGVPDLRNLTLRVESSRRAGDVRVLDNTLGKRLYALTKDIDDPRGTEVLELIDTTRLSGAFNILDNVQRGNTLVAQADPQLVPPPLTIYWSTSNNESVKTTFFDSATNAAYILGDRTTGSDEFDDSVILHEYAHMLAARFSRDDSPGGPHIMGDKLDPRLAWSEGWANFFSAAVRGTPIYLDSKGPGVPVVRFDLEENVPANDRPGYWSEASVDGLLWDLLDENADKDDLAQFPFGVIWAAFTDLRNVRFVYLPSFLESLLSKNPGISDALRTMVVARSIDFQPEVRPSAVDPFPRPIGVGITQFKKGNVDSFTSKRWNLSNSSHFYTFATNGGNATITLNIEGLGPAANPSANDLDLFLYDGNGRRLELSRNLNGQPELITGIRLNPGTYYLEVRSYYERAETGTMVYNSGEYRLTVLVQ